MLVIWEFEIFHLGDWKPVLSFETADLLKAGEIIDTFTKGKVQVSSLKGTPWGWTSASHTFREPRPSVKEEMDVGVFNVLDTFLLREGLRSSGPLLKLVGRHRALSKVETFYLRAMNPGLLGAQAAWTWFWLHRSAYILEEIQIDAHTFRPEEPLRGEHHDDFDKIKGFFCASLRAWLDQMFPYKP